MTPEKRIVQRLPAVVPVDGKLYWNAETDPSVLATVATPEDVKKWLDQADTEELRSMGYIRRSDIDFGLEALGLSPEVRTAVNDIAQELVGARVDETQRADRLATQLDVANEQLGEIKALVKAGECTDQPSPATGVRQLLNRVRQERAKSDQLTAQHIPLLKVLDAARRACCGYGTAALEHAVEDYDKKARETPVEGYSWSDVPVRKHARKRPASPQADGLEDPRPRTSVRRFSVAMETRLRRHDATKGPQGWTHMSPEKLLRMLKQEVGELQQAVELGRDIMAEAADVANFAMMVFDIYVEKPKLYRPRPPKDPFGDPKHSFTCPRCGSHKYGTTQVFIADCHGPGCRFSALRPMDPATGQLKTKKGVHTFGVGDTVKSLIPDEAAREEGLITKVGKSGTVLVRWVELPRSEWRDPRGLGLLRECDVP